MSYRITQAHDGWRASYEGHGVKLSVTRMSNETEAVTNLNRLLVYHGLSRVQLCGRNQAAQIK